MLNKNISKNIEQIVKRQINIAPTLTSEFFYSRTMNQTVIKELNIPDRLRYFSCTLVLKGVTPNPQ